MNDDVYAKRQKAQAKIDAMKKEVAELDKEIKRLQDIEKAKEKKRQDDFYFLLDNKLSKCQEGLSSVGHYEYWDDSDQLVGRLLDKLTDKKTATELYYDYETVVNEAIQEVDEDITQASNMKIVLTRFLSELKKVK